MKIFAAIYIGSYEISLKIFELAAKKTLREIDHVRYRMELGKDVYGSGSIGYKQADELCSVLNEFAEIMQGYKADDYRIYAGPVFSDADNELFLLNQIELRTGFQVQVLSNSEQRFLSYKVAALAPEFARLTQEGAAVVDVGGGSVQITLFLSGRVVTTQHLMIGTMRVRGKLAGLEQSAKYPQEQIQELVDKELEGFKLLHLKDKEIRHVILMGDYIREVVRQLDKNGGSRVKAERFFEYLDKLKRKHIEEIAELLNLSNDRDTLVMPALVLYKQTVEALGAKEIYAPGIGINDGIAYDYVLKQGLVRTAHDFEEDVISAARNMAERYCCNREHMEALTEISGKLFDAMKRVHGLGKRERLLLKTAAILHDCGKYVSMVGAAGSSYSIIMATEIIGLSHLEREIVARVVLYNAYSLEPYEAVADKLDKESYLVVAKLAAILRLSNAMDKSHRQKLRNIKAAVTGRKLVITVETKEDILLEKGVFQARLGFFEEVFSIKPVLKEKRIYES